MSKDELAIRDLVSTWMSASQNGDTKAVLGLIADDVVFMVPGREPFGLQEFADASDAMRNTRMRGKSEIVELQLLGGWAFVRNHVTVTLTPPGGKPVKKAGYTLTILRKDPDGKWRLVRDANLVTG